MTPTRPKRIWWARPRKLCALERPGGGGRSHRPDRREAEIGYLLERGVRLVISTMRTRHTDFVAAVCAAHLHEHKDVHPAASLAAAAQAGLTVTKDAARLLGVDE